MSSISKPAAELKQTAQGPPQFQVASVVSIDARAIFFGQMPVWGKGAHGGMESTSNDKQSSEQIVVRNVCGWHVHLGLWILDERASAVRQLGRVAVVDCRFHDQLESEIGMGLLLASMIPGVLSLRPG